MQSSYKIIKSSNYKLLRALYALPAIYWEQISRISILLRWVREIYVLQRKTVLIEESILFWAKQLKRVRRRCLMISFYFCTLRNFISSRSVNLFSGAWSENSSLLDPKTPSPDGCVLKAFYLFIGGHYRERNKKRRRKVAVRSIQEVGLPYNIKKAA
jgi:hypothetical protein